MYVFTHSLASSLMSIMYYTATATAGIMEIRGSYMKIQPGYPKQIWGASITSSATTITTTSTAAASSTIASTTSNTKAPKKEKAASALPAVVSAGGEDSVLHYVLKVDR